MLRLTNEMLSTPIQPAGIQYMTRLPPPGASGAYARAAVWRTLHQFPGDRSL